MNEGTFSCLHDSKRTNAFRRAIKNSVKKDDVVVEIGAGSGILSMFAVDAGAKKVYAVELDKGNINSLKMTVAENGYSDKITIVHGDATTIDLPQKVDFIICEMIATGLIEELQVIAMNNVLRFLKPVGKVLIEEYHIFLELVSSKSKFYDKTFNIIRFELPEMRDMRSVPFTKKILFKSVNFLKKNHNLINETVSLKAITTGIVNAIRISGETVFADKSKFKNSTSYDFPIILPIDPIAVKRGEIVNFLISYKMCEGPRTLRYMIVK